MNTEDIKNILRNIPNSVSGDGKTFVAALKNYLTKYGLVTDEKIDSALEELTKKPNHVDSITLLELHAITDGVRSNNIQISWDTTPVNDYAKAEIWYTRAADSSWEKAGEASGTQYVMQGATAGETYHIRVVAVNSKGVAADFDTAPIANIIIKGSRYIPAPPTQFVLTWDEQGPLWKWLFEDNNYVDFFELRLDQNPGVWNDKRLDSTRELWSRANPGVRAGTAYLYIRNIFGEYSEPAVHQFNKVMPGKPEAPVLTSTLDGVHIKMSPLPQGNTGYKIHIKTSDGTEDDFTTVNSEYIYFFFLGTITVKYCFVDILGEGEWSDEATCDIKAGIEVGQVPTINYDKLSDAVKDAIDIANKQPDINIGLGNNIKDINATMAELDKNITANTSSIQQNADGISAVVKRVTTVEGEVTAHGTAINQTADSIAAVVTELNKKPADCNYSSISMLQDDILLTVKKDGVINAINVSTEGIVIDGKKVHITGDTVFDNNVIVGGMIAANSIAMEHLKANSISSAKIQANAITADKIAAGAVTAEKVEAGAITADKLAAGSVTSNAIQAGSIIGDKIAANSVSGKHLSAENIDLLGALAVTGGAVKLSEEGLRCTEESGGYTLFDKRGITFYDKSGNQYSQLHRICVGTAAHGSHVTFTAPWTQVPKVICVPTELQCGESQYAQSNIFIICRAVNITTNGFDVNCYTRLDEGSSVTIPYNDDYVGTTTDNIKVIDRHNFEAYFDKELTVPKSATEGVVSAELTSLAAGSYHHNDHQSYSTKTNHTYKMQIIYQENVIAESEYTPLPKTYGDNYSEKLKTKQNLSFQLPSVMDYEVKVTLRIVSARYHKERWGGLTPPTSITLESDTVTLLSASYDSGTFIISTGAAAFIAIENANGDYSTTEATWSIRQDA